MRKPTAEVWSPVLPIETDRLILRGHLLTDLDDLVIFHGDPEVTRYIPWPVRTREQTAAALELKLAQTVVTSEGGWIVLAVEERSSATVIGEVLLKRADDAARTGEVGYAFARSAQGRGLASEAVRAILELGFATFGLRTIVAQVELGNAASARLLARLGFVRDAETVNAADGIELAVFRRTIPT
ncbi:GNAT family N-acetyltransferase [Plantibacter flavus]|uniref:GNAT family N-acetyltransferase n=1 Tax=Plantibacter flavus TaxID=150123 RepID=UPI003F17C4BB